MVLTKRIFLSLMLCATWRYSDALATMSIDLSSEFLKIAIVKPGVPMEIVLNSESQRKTPLAVALRNGERTFGEAALSTCVKAPKNCFVFFLDLLGKNTSHPLVKLYLDRFPQYNLEDDAKTNRLVYRIDSDTKFSPEELLAMLIKYGKGLAEKYAEQPITDGVITIPPYFTQIERLAVTYAAKLAGFNVLQLLNDNTAAAINYGVFRRKEMNSSIQHIMLYDMGSTGTTATVIGYQVTKPKEGGENAILHIKGVGYDRSLGGLEIDLRLRQFFVKKFLEKSKKDADKNPQALVKLLKEAARVKKVLSANTEHMAQIESLMEDVDFSTKLLRSDLELICEDVFNRIPGVVEQAVLAANIGIDELQQIIIIGGGTRIPKVQEKLLAAVKRTELGKNLNSDEAVALGAVYQAAHLSKGFKVKQFEITDATLIPIAVEFERGSKEHSAEKSEEPASRLVKRILFGRSNGYPQRKVLTFPKHQSDFSFSVRYADYEFLSAVEQSYISGGLSFGIDLKGVGEAYEKNQDKRFKGVKAHFKVDHSGIFALDSAEATFEYEKEQEVPSTMEKIGQSITNFFSGSSANETENVTLPEPVSSDINAATGNESATNFTEKAGDDVGKIFTKTMVNKTATLKEELKETVTRLDSAVYPDKEYLESKKRLIAMDEKDREKAEREKARNALETYIFDIQDKLYQPSHEKVSTQEERESLLKSFKETSEWLDEDSGAEGASIYKAKLKALETLMKDIVERVTETKKRPEMLEELDKQIGLAKTFMEFMTNGSLNGVFTETEVDGIKKLLKDTEDWKRTNVELQEKSSLTSAPVLRVADIVEKGRALDREVNYLLNKMKIAKSKAKTEKKDKKPAESAAKSNDTTKHKPEDSGDNVSQDDSTLQDIKDNEDDTNQEKTPAVDEEGTGREESVSGEAENASGPESSRKQTKGGKEPVTHSPEDL